jgi:hypothetical protein
MSMLEAPAFIAALEIFLLFSVRSFRKDFQWLITESDEVPRLDEKGLEKFFKHGHDPELGWVRKPHTRGVEKGGDREVTYSIDGSGARTNPLQGLSEPSIAAFGDSYVFCRQVNDDETWPVYLADQIHAGVLNFGVGNYGVDQAVLRYEKTMLPRSVKMVILGFVPETICRVQSYWKHYLEFGNTFAFKPRFKLGKEGIAFLPNVMQNQRDFLALEEKLKSVRGHDGFYRKKFRSRQFRFPYLLSYMRNLRLNTALFGRLAQRWAARKMGRSTLAIENAPFGLIMESNIKEVHQMYCDKEACRLLRLILLRFRDSALQKGHRPVILVMPQLMDLKLCQGKQMPYGRFFKDLEHDVTTLDLTDHILSQSRDDLYVEDSYGGHFSRTGNALIARQIAMALEGAIAHGGNR